MYDQPFYQGANNFEETENNNTTEEMDHKIATMRKKNVKICQSKIANNISKKKV